MGKVWTGTLVIALVAGSGGLRADPPCGEPSQESFLRRIAPAGGFHPYGGRLLNWWPRNCFPTCGGPDDYCRKPLPPICWPAYPLYFIWAPPESCCSCTDGSCQKVPH